MLRARRIGRSRSATQTGSGIRIVSTKQEVGMGEEILECGPCVDCQFIRTIPATKENNLRSPQPDENKASPSLLLTVEL